jgi:predicted transcriptional regulator
MESPSPAEELLSFFKALADANRLRIVGLLAGGPLSVEQLAAMLDLRPSTVSHHLSRLSQAGLVSSSSESYYHMYRLETDTLAEMAQRLLSKETLPVVAADVDIDAYDRKVLQVYLGADGRLKDLPGQWKKLQVVLRHILPAFDLGTRYSEQQVNEILERFHPDTATLRREMIANKMMGREGGGGEYWRIE